MAAKRLTIAKLADHYGFDVSLVRAVARNLGDDWRDTLRDVARHGAAGGFSGFTYYTDTIAFFKKHRAVIVAMAENEAESLGDGSALEMVAGFNCLAGHKGDKREYYPSVSRCLYGGRLTDDDTDVANALAWFALETVARAFDDENDR